MLPSFREQLRSDVADNVVFFHEGEFAAFHDIEGKRILSVLCSDSRAGAQRRGKEEDRPEGVSLETCVLFLRTQDIVGLPKRDQLLRVDGRLFRVTGVLTVGDAAVRIALEANEP